MESLSVKRSIYRISLIFIILISAVLCIYEVQHNKNNTIVQNFQFGREGNMPSNIQNNSDSTKNNMPLQNNDLNSGDNADQDQNDQSNIGETNRLEDNKNNRQGQNKNGEFQANNNAESKSNENRQFEDSQNNRLDQDETTQSTSNVDNVANKNGNRTANINGNKQQRSNNNFQSGRQNGNMQRGSADPKYLPALTIYSLIFLMLSSGMYYLFKKKKIKVNLTDEKFLIFTVLSVGFFLRVTLSTIMPAHNDVNLFRSWASTAANGLSQFYSNARQADYPPLYIYMLALIGRLISSFDLSPYYVLMLKVPSILADIATGYFIYKLSKRYFDQVICICLSIFYVFNPAIFIDSTIWGQVDSLFTLLIVIALFLLNEKKYVFSSVMFAAAVLMKPQGIIFLPILFFELVRQRKIKNFIFTVIAAIITIVIVIIPFSLNGQSPLWIFDLYSKTISEYPYASVNGFNFFSLLGANYKLDTTTFFIINYHTFGMIFIVITTLTSWFIYTKGNNRIYISAIALLQIAGVFTFSVGMHERYLFPAVVLSILAFIYLKDRRFFIMAIGFSITSYLNISSVFFRMDTTYFNILLKVTSILNILLVMYLIKVLFDNVIKKYTLEL